MYGPTQYIPATHYSTSSTTQVTVCVPCWGSVWIGIDHAAEQRPPRKRVRGLPLEPPPGYELPRLPGPLPISPWRGRDYMLRPRV